MEDLSFYISRFLQQNNQRLAYFLQLNPPSGRNLVQNIWVDIPVTRGRTTPGARPLTVIHGASAGASERVKAARVDLLILDSRWSEPGRKARQSSRLIIHLLSRGGSARANAWLSKKGAVKLIIEYRFQSSQRVLSQFSFSKITALLTKPYKAPCIQDAWEHPANLHGLRKVRL